MPEKNQFPIIIYVSIEGNESGNWYVAESKLEKFAEGAKMGVYELREVKNHKVKHSLE